MKRVKLTGGGYEAVILPEFGANCVSLTHLETGASLLRTPETEEAFTETPYLYGTPLLFPPNRLEDGKFDFEGKTYQFSINEPERRVHLHGELFRTAFEVIREEKNGASFMFRATMEQPYFDYHALRVEVTYMLDENGLTQTIMLTNEGDEDLPIGLGYHTAFPIPFLPGGRAEDIRIQSDLGAEYARDPERLLTIWEPLPNSETHQEFENGSFYPHGKGISAHYRCGERRMRVVDQATGIAIVYEVSEGYFSWLIWKAQDGGFVCLEPQSWLVNAPYAPDPKDAGLKVIAPYECMEFTGCLYILA